MKIANIIEEMLNEGARAHDWVEQYGEIGQIHKVRGRAAYVKFPSTKDIAFDVIELASLKKTGKKHKGKDLYLSEGKVTEKKEHEVAPIIKAIFNLGKNKKAAITIGNKEYKIMKKGGRIHLINVKYSSDKYVFQNKKDMKSFLDDQTEPIGGIQSSQFGEGKLTEATIGKLEKELEKIILKHVKDGQKMDKEEERKHFTAIKQTVKLFPFSKFRQLRGEGKLNEGKIKHIDIWFEDRRGRFYKVKINGGRAPREWDGWSNAQDSLSKLLGWEIHLRSMDDNKLEKAAKQLKKQGIKLTWDDAMDVS